jgi:hypothetical protein
MAWNIASLWQKWKVPTAEATTNVCVRDVVGNKTDTSVQLVGTTNSIMALLKGVLQAVTMLGGLPPVNGRTYWVDYELGADTNDGLSPGKPFKLLSAAITAAETYRAACTNVHTRNRILLMGGVTPQPGITVLPNYCDIIGIGATPSGDGVGIARIGTGKDAAGVATATTNRGLYFKNLQFLGGDGLAAFQASALLRSTFEDCAFCDSAALTSTAMLAGFKGVGTVAGCVFRRCRIGMTNIAHWCLYGIYFGAQCTQNLIEDCDIQGATAGIYTHTDVNENQLLVRDCVIGDQGGGCAKGVDDNGNGLAMYARNAITGTDAIEMTAHGDVRLLDNKVVNGTTPVCEPKHADA